MRKNKDSAADEPEPEGTRPVDDAPAGFMSRRELWDELARKLHDREVPVEDQARLDALLKEGHRSYQTYRDRVQALLHWALAWIPTEKEAGRHNDAAKRGEARRKRRGVIPEPLKNWRDWHERLVAMGLRCSIEGRDYSTEQLLWMLRNVQDLEERLEEEQREAGATYRTDPETGREYLPIRNPYSLTYLAARSDDFRDDTHRLLGLAFPGTHGRWQTVTAGLCQLMHLRNRDGLGNRKAAAWVAELFTLARVPHPTNHATKSAHDCAEKKCPTVYTWTEGTVLKRFKDNKARYPTPPLTPGSRA